MSFGSLVQRVAILFFLAWALISCFREEEGRVPEWDKLLGERGFSEDGPVSWDSVFAGGEWDAWDAEAFRPAPAQSYSGLSEFGDSISILKILFTNDYLAFGLFRKIAGEEFQGLREIPRSEGVYLKNGSAIFFLKIRGNGLWDFNKIREFHFLSDSGSIIPAIFNSFPLQGRIPYSERIIPKYFLGWERVGDVAAVSYPCYFDTLVVFRTFFNPWQESFSRAIQNFGGEIDSLSRDLLEFTGETEFGDPLVLYGHSTGLLGAVGCPDWDFTQKMAQKSLNLNAVADIIP